MYYNSGTSSQCKQLSEHNSHRRQPSSTCTYKVQQSEVILNDNDFAAYQSNFKWRMPFRLIFFLKIYLLSRWSDFRHLVYSQTNCNWLLISLIVMNDQKNSTGSRKSSSHKNNVSLNFRFAYDVVK